MQDLKIKALAKFIGAAVEDIDNLGRSEDEFSASGEEYRVLTDEEADRAAREYILDSVWAFRPEFLAAHVVEGVDADAVKAIQSNNRCEDNNPVLRRLLKDEDHFVENAIKADGRGRFLSGYDGEEHEAIVEDGAGRIAFYIYRTN